MTGLGIWLAGKNTLALLSANASRSLADTVGGIERHLRPAEDRARFIAGRIEAGAVDPEDRERFSLLLTGALAGVPQIESVALFGPELTSFFAARRGDDRFELGEVDHAGDARFSS
ncbi:MAG: hypothetical protein OXQ84_02210 [bacterium]|nr:hypothetical protein [bacterium]